MLTKSQLKSAFSEYGFRPLKRLGENYLIDGNIKDKIILNAGVKKEDVVLEIGPGFGALTIDLAQSGAAVFAVEKDKKAFNILKDMTGGKFPNLKIFNADILEFDLKNIVTDKPIKVIGNLPYYITTPAIEYIIRNRALIGSALIMVQREVANRILALPGRKDYSSISCFAQYYAKSSYVYTVKRTSFYPSPDVDSSLMRLDMLDEPSVKVRDESLFFRIIRGSFNQRRKTIINSLSREEVLDIPKERLEEILKEALIDPAVRPEDLSLSDFARIADALWLAKN